MVTGAQRRHGEAHSALPAYEAALRRVERRRRLLRVACARDVDRRIIDRLASLTAESTGLVQRIRVKYFGNPDTDGDWITKRG